MSGPLTLLLTPLMNWGMTLNGKCLTAKITESRKTGNECLLLDILEEKVPEKYFLSEKSVERLMGKRNAFQAGPIREVNQIGNIVDTDSFGGNPQCGRVYGIDGISPTINTCGGGQREPKIAIREATKTENLKIRKLTPLECWRLQGFTDEQFHKAQAVNSNSQLYKQAGNSVTVNVVYEIARRLV